MGNPWTVGILLAAVSATSALGAEWREAWKSDSASSSFDRQSMKRLDGSKIRVNIMMKYAKAQPQAGAKFVIPEHDTTIGDYVVNCADYASTINRNTWYLNSNVVREWTGAGNLPPPNQFEHGVPAAFKLACSSVGR